MPTAKTAQELEALIMASLADVAREYGITGVAVTADEKIEGAWLVAAVPRTRKRSRAFRLALIRLWIQMLPIYTLREERRAI